MVDLPTEMLSKRVRICVIFFTILGMGLKWNYRNGHLLNIGSGPFNKFIEGVTLWALSVEGVHTIRWLSPIAVSHGTFRNSKHVVNELITYVLKVINS